MPRHEGAGSKYGAGHLRAPPPERARYSRAAGFGQEQTIQEVRESGHWLTLLGDMSDLKVFLELMLKLRPRYAFIFMALSSV